MIGTIINDRYKIEIEIGRGGMGADYTAALRPPIAACQALDATLSRLAGQFLILERCRY
jgi:hypothetical protein